MKKALRLTVLLALLASSLTFAPAASAGPQACDRRVNDTAKKLIECITLDGVRAHQAALQAIADDNNGTRAAGTAGYEDSADYVEAQMTAAGYDVSRHSFPFTFVPPPTLRQLTPVDATYATGAFTGTGYGEVTGAVIGVDLFLDPPRASSSGCDGAFTEAVVGGPIVPDPDGPDDFATFVSGSIALVQRGTCSFALKVTNAQAAGASAVIVMNQGSDPTRLGLIIGTLGTLQATVPVVGASFADGVALSQAGSTAFVKVDPPIQMTQENVIAESRAGDPNNVVMAGAHLDSVQAGPGINDNGSGSAALLETAIQLKKVKPINKLRFAWWGAEESGLVGSIAYVNDLSADERAKISLYLNFDMVGSPNHVFFIYDGDDSDAVGAPAGPPGSAEIEETFEDYFNMVGEPFKGTDFSGRSDYGPFIAAGIPSGGLFTGAEGVKTAAEAAVWGGTAGQQYDPCYHLACDTFANNNNHALDVNADAIGYATVLYAMGVETLPEATVGTLRTTGRSGPQAVDLNPAE
jgi:Zn-dependent M28 family amino/carboxypeptidase